MRRLISRPGESSILMRPNTASSNPRLRLYLHPRRRGSAFRRHRYPDVRDAARRRSGDRQHLDFQSRRHVRARRATRASPALDHRRKPVQEPVRRQPHRQPQIYPSRTGYRLCRSWQNAKGSEGADGRDRRVQETRQPDLFSVGIDAADAACRGGSGPRQICERGRRCVTGVRRNPCGIVGRSDRGQGRRRLREGEGRPESDLRQADSARGGAGSAAACLAGTRILHLQARRPAAQNRSRRGRHGL